MKNEMSVETVEKKDLKIRAIYIGDVRFDSCPVFELNTETHQFVMISDNEFTYDDLTVYDDKDFLVFEVYKESSDNSNDCLDENFENEEIYEEIETVKML